MYQDGKNATSPYTHRILRAGSRQQTKPPGRYMQVGTLSQIWTESFLSYIWVIIISSEYIEYDKIRFCIPRSCRGYRSN
jgi:hypothetical protein